MDQTIKSGGEKVLVSSVVLFYGTEMDTEPGTRLCAGGFFGGSWNYQHLQPPFLSSFLKTRDPV